MDMRKYILAAGLIVTVGVLTSAEGPRHVALGDWPEARGPNGDGVSKETGLVEKWALNGQNFLWRAPYGGRSAPIVMGNRVYVQNPAEHGPALQERVMALDADTGKMVWEYRFNVFQCDVPPHRVAWASPAADPETGNIYALSVGAQVIALSKDGKLLWDRSIGEEYSAFTTHGGRTMSPIIDGNLVIVTAAISNWGTAANRSHRFVALDKRTGDIVYLSNPGGRPYDTAYAAPMIATINGMRLLIAGLGDGGIHAIKPQTGEKVWSFVAAKRAINTGVVVKGTSVIISHGDENLESNELGMIAAIDGSQTGDIKTTKWANKGDQFGFSSPVIDGPRVYEIENGSRLKAFDVETGRELWHQAARHAAEGAARARGREAVRRQRKRQVLHRAAVRGSRRGAERSLPAVEHQQRPAGGRHARADSGGRGGFEGPYLLRLERRRLCYRPQDAEAGDRQRRRPAGGERRGRADVPASVSNRDGAQARTDGDAARQAVRRQGPIPARGSRGGRGRCRDSPAR